MPAGVGSLAVIREHDVFGRPSGLTEDGPGTNIHGGDNIAPAQARAMTIELINPAGLPPQATYTQVVVATGTTMVFIAGQEPEDSHGNSVAPGDLAAQGRQVYANLGRALAAGSCGHVPRAVAVGC
jgi:Endoribonuclease L-PSP